jgi:hypothetical protein
VDAAQRHARREPSLLTPDRIPVLLGFRLSLSFPLVVTALRLYAPQLETPQGPPVEHWFSDGGIGSNFPVHFFDAWVPSRPTFALSFASLPVDAAGRLLPGESDVGLPPTPSEIRFPRWIPVGDMGAFVAQILEIMQNWRATMQAELPGFRDRVYEARLDKAAGEGGLNLGMDAATIRRLQDRGTRVGEAIAETFDWDQHFFTRYLIAMQQLELGLLGNMSEGGPVLRRGVHGALEARLADFAAGDVRARELFGRDANWLRQAGAASWEIAAGHGAVGGLRAIPERPAPAQAVDAHRPRRLSCQSQTGGRGAWVRPNGLPSGSRQTAHRSPGWMTSPPFALTRSSADSRSGTDR